VLEPVRGGVVSHPDTTCKQARAPRRPRLLASTLVLGAVAGCIDGGTPDGVIDYKLAGGIAGERGEVHIASDGTMTRLHFDGSTDTSALSRSTFEDLRRKIEDARFRTLRSMYGPDCCDVFIHTVSVDIDGRTYTVHAADHVSYPDRLRPLITTLEALLDTEGL
jgi:hypothetical protein